MLENQFKNLRLFNSFRFLKMINQNENDIENNENSYKIPGILSKLL